MPKIYKKKILVTGGAGFIGSTYLNKFVRIYPEYLFINVDVLTYAGSLDNLTITNAANYQFEQVDIRVFPDLEKVFKKYQPTDIIHFAAETHVDISIAHPSVFIETNIIGTHNLLRLAKEYGINRFFQISTDEVYGSLADTTSLFTEESSLAPNSPYSASKAAAELLARSYHQTFGLDIIISRSSNNFGPRQDLTKLIPKFITNLLANKKVPLYNTGVNMRDWIFVEDAVDALDRVFHKGRSGAIYNIGGGAQKSNLEITELLLELLGKDKSLIAYTADRAGHDFRYALDIRKIKRELDWQPTSDFRDSLTKTITWYKKMHSFER